MRDPFLAVDSQDLRLQPELDVTLAEPVAAAERQPGLGGGAGEVILGQVGTVLGRVAIRAQHPYAARIAETSKRIGTGQGRGATADDQDPVDIGSQRRRGIRAVVFANIGLACFDDHAPARERVESGGAKRPARPEVETDMVKRAEYPVPVHQS